MQLAIITGASRGLGAALVRILEQDPNYQIVAVVRDVKAHESSARVTYIQLDLRNLDSAVEFATQVSLKPISAVTFFSCAGVISPICQSEQITPTDITTAFTVNSFAPFMVAATLAARTKQLGIKLKIINVSSGAARRPIEGWAAYCGSKSASEALFHVLEKEQTQLSINNYDPGVIDTLMQKEIRDSSCPDAPSFQAKYEDSSLQSPAEAAQRLLTTFGHKC